MSNPAQSYERMFHAACLDLAAINEALDLDPDDGGAVPILDAIAELKARVAPTEAAAMAATVPADQLSYLKNLTIGTFNRHYAMDEHYVTGASKWEPCEDAAGLLSQLDNMLTGLCRAPVAGQPAEPSPADLWYLQDTRSYVGNDVLWWAREGAGYTTDVSKAHVFTRDEAFRQAAMRGCDRAWPKAYIDGKTRPAVDMQYINHDEALEFAPKGDSNG